MRRPISRTEPSPSTPLCFAKGVARLDAEYLHWVAQLRFRFKMRRWKRGLGRLLGANAARCEQMFFGPHLLADIEHRCRHVRFVPSTGLLFETPRRRSRSARLVQCGEVRHGATPMPRQPNWGSTNISTNQISDAGAPQMVKRGQAVHRPTAGRKGPTKSNISSPKAKSESETQKISDGSWLRRGES
jgi:hypothetical protein